MKRDSNGRFVSDRSSLRQRALRAGINPNTVIWRIKRGETEREALTPVLGRPDSLAAQAKAANLSPETVYSRYYRGWDRRDLLIPKHARRKHGKHKDLRVRL